MSTLWNTMRKIPAAFSVSKMPVRYLNLLEYQSKRLLQNSNVTVQEFCMVDEDKGLDDFEKFTAAEYVVKAQILAGGRGKGHFSNGYKGGVHLTKKKEEAKEMVSSMLGHKLITKQTPKDGIKVRKVMVASSVNIVRETYLCFLMDRGYNGPVIIASPAGGMDIEAVASKTPHLIKKVPVDIFEGVTDAMANDIAQFLEFKGTKQKAADEIVKLWKMFLKVDSVQLEINPLAETDDQKVVAVDAKVNFDDNASFRQKEIFAMEDKSETDPREVQAAKYNLNYIGMTGNIGCLVNGAGLAMATMDIIKLYGGEPANFLDVGGNVQEEAVKAGFRILASDPQVKAILVNVFGGIVNCAIVAKGIIGASKGLSIPLVVRLEGTNAEEARKLIDASGLNIIAGTGFEDAAKKVVKFV